MRRWVAAGQDPSAFWQITPREMLVILDGADARDKAQMRINQAVAWATASLVMTGFHDPKKFPKFDKAFPDPEARRVARTPDEIWTEMERWVAVHDLIEEQHSKEVP